MLKQTTVRFETKEKIADLEMRKAQEEMSSPEWIRSSRRSSKQHVLCSERHFGSAVRAPDAGVVLVAEVHFRFACEDANLQTNESNLGTDSSRPLGGGVVVRSTQRNVLL